MQRGIGPKNNKSGLGAIMLNTVENLSEPFQIEDVYVSELGGIEDAGDGNVRFVFGVRKHGAVESRVALVAGPTLIWLTIREVMRHFGRKCCGALYERPTH